MGVKKKEWGKGNEESQGLEMSPMTLQSNVTTQRRDEEAIRIVSKNL